MMIKIMISIRIMALYNDVDPEMLKYVEQVEYIPYIPKGHSMCYSFSLFHLHFVHVFFSSFCKLIFVFTTFRVPVVSSQLEESAFLIQI